MDESYLMPRFWTCPVCKEKFRKFREPYRWVDVPTYETDWEFNKRIFNHLAVHIKEVN